MSQIHVEIESCSHELPYPLAGLLRQSLQLIASYVLLIRYDTCSHWHRDKLWSIFGSTIASESGLAPSSHY